ncbi:hypothetical protein ACP2AV_00940 [Aliiroseovarius sp. PTFE2010]|uniref:hypothetical protein n=1 Tax=Aliiroseovarius sp. PTFE2010 TaxID=3417190 RepID=UPI003CE9A966
MKRFALNGLPHEPAFSCSGAFVPGETVSIRATPGPEGGKLCQNGSNQAKSTANACKVAVGDRGFDAKDLDGVNFDSIDSAYVERMGLVRRAAPGGIYPDAILIDGGCVNSAMKTITEVTV